MWTQHGIALSLQQDTHHIRKPQPLLTVYELRVMASKQASPKKVKPPASRTNAVSVTVLPSGASSCTSPILTT
jgi:hypothetical protein